MNVTPVSNPLEGEQIVAVDPPLLPRVDAGWRRRLHLFAGRSLAAAALTGGQAARAAQAALLARALSPGIVAGLETGLQGASHADAMLDVAPGLGLTAWGEDVRLPHALRVRLDQIQTIAPEGGGAGRTLGELLPSVPRPAALVLLLQPVLVEEAGVVDPSDPTERDVASEAFEDRRIVDACRPLLALWPQGWPLPAPGARWRNRLAGEVFERARGGPLPWELLGLPLALIGWDEALATLFLDRSVVARAGGRPRSRTGLVPEAGDPGLWEARVRQCAEHLADLLAAPGAAPADAAAHFERLPPAGLLPVDAATFARPLKDSINPDGGDQRFFPDLFRIEAVPIPLEELEPVFAAALPLAPLDLVQPEEVRLLVPVPASLYDPDLLVQDRVDPSFAETLESFRADRGRWLGRREDVREKFNTLLKSLQGGGAQLPYPEVDPEAQTGESPVPPVPPEEAYGTFPGDTDTKVAVLRDLKDLFQSVPYAAIGREWDADLLGREGLEGLIRVLAAKAAKANDKIDLGFLALQTEIYRVRQIALGNVEASRLATSPVLASIAQGDSARATRENLTRVFRGSGRTPAAIAEAAAVPSASTFTQNAAGFQLNPSAVVADDVREESPLPGLTIDRSLSVAQRLSIPPVHQAQSYALSNQLQILTGLAETGIEVDDLAIPLYRLNANQVRERVEVSWREVRERLADHILGQPLVQDADEANVLGDAVGFQEHAGIVLRRLEGRVQLYQNALGRCRRAADEIRRHQAAARQRLSAIDRELAEARHDVTVARALLAEETRRVETINARRQDVLANHVPFLAWHRPRVADTFADLPARPLDPGRFEDPVPAALAQPADAPAELREMVDLLREAPLRWFRRLPPLLARLDRLDVLRDTLRHARSRAEAALSGPSLLPPAPVTAGAAAEGTGAALAAQRRMAVEHRTVRARLDLAAVERQSWKGAADLAHQVLSLGDLLDASHGRAEVSRLGARELDDILRVATALWADFAAVLPALRLDWIERLSQLDAPFDLRNLSNLPRWEEIEVLDRRALQALVDWLFQRIDTGVPEAVALINDLVRVCVLLASHAPVDRIVAGHVAEDTHLRPGATVPLVVDLARVRIGMQVVLFAQEQPVARGIVEDLGDGRATARVLQAFAAAVSVTKNARVEFTDFAGTA